MKLTIQNKLNNKLLLTDSNTTLKSFVTKEVTQLEQLRIPCCIITKNEYYNHDVNDIVDRESVLMPFANIDLKPFCKTRDMLTQFIVCLLELGYQTILSDNDKIEIEKICSQEILNIKSLPLFQILKSIQEKTSLRDVLTTFARKVDSTVETVKNNHIFFSECNDIAILFTNLLHILLRMEPTQEKEFYIYTDIIDAINNNEHAISLLGNILTYLDCSQVHIVFMVTETPSNIKNLNLSTMQVIGNPHDYSKFLDQQGICLQKFGIPRMNHIYSLPLK